MRLPGNIVGPPPLFRSVSKMASAAFILAVLTSASLFPQGRLAQRPEEYLKSGIQAFQEHNFAAAVHSFSKLVQVDSSGPNYSYLAMAEAANGQLERAIADFRKSIQLGNNSANVLYNLGLAYIKRGQPESAIEEFRQAVAVKPNYVLARYALGMTLLKMGRAQQAIGVITHAQKLYTAS